MARPGGNATGFILFEYGINEKWLELLKQIAPGVTRAAVIRDPGITAGIGQFGAIQSAAPSLGLAITPVNVHDAGEIERAVAAFARTPNGGLIVTGSGLAVTDTRDTAFRCEAGSRGRLGQSEMAINYRTRFAYRIDAWDAHGENVIEHLAGVEDLQVAKATYLAACQRWPGHQSPCAKAHE